MNGKQKRSVEIDFNSICTVDLYPYEEVEKVMGALKAAEKQGDLKALKWCARRILWFFDMASTSTGSLSSEQMGKLFDSAYLGLDDHPPASIARLVA